MIGIRNGLSTLLAGMLVFNASCACASVIRGAEIESHAHHHPSEHAVPAGDCAHVDCAGNCDKAMDVAPGKATGQPNPHKFGQDNLAWATVDVDLEVSRNLASATGPPPELIPKTHTTPVLRFDLLLE